jgi:predicted transcriptional regulator
MGKRYNMEFPDDLHDALDALAKKRDSTVAEQIRRAIRLLLIAEKIQQDPQQQLAVKKGRKVEPIHII